MFLSDEAMLFLNSKQYDLLQALSLEKLLGGSALDDIKNNHFSIEAMEAASLNSRMLSVECAQDPVILSTMVDPVVISSGHIFSRETAERLLLARVPTCPITKKPITRDLISLPQITYGIAMARFQKSIEMEAAIANAQSEAATNSTANILAAFVVEDAIADVYNTYPTLELLASNSKIRLILSGGKKHLELILKTVFTNQQNQIPDGSSYSINLGSIAWHAQGYRVRVEFAVEKSKMKNSYVIKALEETLKPLNLEQEPLPDDFQPEDITTTPDKVYRPLLKESIRLKDFQQSALCLIGFLKAIHQIKKLSGYENQPNVAKACADNKIVPSTTGKPIDLAEPKAPTPRSNTSITSTSASLSMTSMHSRK